MDPQVNLSVTFQGDTQTFLVSDSSNTTWADVEAMVKVSFDLNDIQIKYLDEDCDEVSVNSAEEYEEALKIAAKQGRQLQMNVYELSAASGASLCQVLEAPDVFPVPEDGRKPLSHYSMLAQTLGPDRDLEREVGKTQSEDPPSQEPPEWFTNYLEKFREQVVQETVETLEQKLSEKLHLSGQPPGSLSSPARHTPVSPLGQSNPFDWLLPCSNCQAPIVGIRYQCSLCPSYSICELCEAGMYAHDPNHVLLKLRRPALCLSEMQSLGQLSPRLATLEQLRLQKQVDKRFLKAEKQRFRAEKKQRKAEVRELKKQLKLHRKIHLWNSVHAPDSVGLTAARSESLQPNALRLQGYPVIVPTLSAAFVDENLPDGTHLQPKTAFVKHWRMRNIGSMEWNSDTKLKFMWGNLTLLSSEKRDVTVPSLRPGQVGVVSVEFVAPPVEGTYTSHWRLSHKGEQFGPRIWCSVVVDSSSTDCPETGKQMCNFSQKGRSPYTQEESSTEPKAEDFQAAHAAIRGGLASPSAPSQVKSITCEREFYIPSVDLLTAQDLLSFELLDINIVQELEQVPRSSPADAQEGKGKPEYPANQEEGEEDMSGTQFVCETVIRSLTLDAAPDHRPPQKKKSLQTSQQALQDPAHHGPKTEDAARLKSSSTSTVQASESTNQGAEVTKEPELENLLVPDGEESSDREADSDEVRSQASSASSEDYVVILPECFDTSRPLGESMYSSALSQPSSEKGAEGLAGPRGESQPAAHSINEILTTSQVLDAVPLTPQVMGPQPGRSPDLSQDERPQETRSQEACLQAPDPVREGDVSAAPPAEIVARVSASSESSRHTQGSSLAGGLMKGALSVAASAYKALFAGPPSVEQALPVITEEQMTAFLANLSEMGFCDRQLNLQLLQKHNCDMAQVVTELLQQSHSDWYGNQY